MKLFSLVVALAVAGASSVASAQTKSAEALLKDAPLVLQGCVAAGLEKDTYVMKNVHEVKNGQGITSVKPASPVLYWFKDASALKPHVGHMVEVAAKIDGLERSEADVKAGTWNGGVVVELEGPGKDVDVARSEVGNVTGTTGRADTRMSLITATIGHVKRSAATVTNQSRAASIAARSHRRIEEPRYTRAIWRGAFGSIRRSMAKRRPPRPPFAFVGHAPARSSIRA